MAAGASILSDDLAAPVSFCKLGIALPDCNDFNFGIYIFRSRGVVEVEALEDYIAD